MKVCFQGLSLAFQMKSIVLKLKKHQPFLHRSFRTGSRIG